MNAVLFKQPFKTLHNTRVKINKLLQQQIELKMSTIILFI